jgi:site-specific recombinase XerD
MLNSMLLVQHANRTSDLLVFPDEAGNRDTHILEKLKLVCRKAGIKQTTVHALRHSFATHLRMQGVSLADIGELLGHSDLASTQIYAKVYQEYLRGVVAKLTPLMGADAGMDLVLPGTPVPVAVLENSKEV